MYAKFFGLAELPFRITPDPRFLWWSPQHQEARQKILYHITQSIGPIYLLADIGTGKTSLARRIFSDLETDKKNRIVNVFAPKLRTTNAFLRFIMEEFNVPTERSYAGSLKRFEQFLLDQFKEGNRVVLLIDEAQNMNRDMLLLIQHLFNFSTSTEFLIQMALFTQPELKEKLNRLKSLKSRLSVAKLSPLNLDQTKEMLVFRWMVAGGKDLPFQNKAIKEIYNYSKGNPREIVKLANESLIRAVVNQVKTINEKMVVTAESELITE